MLNNCDPYQKPMLVVLALALCAPRVKINFN